MSAPNNAIMLDWLSVAARTYSIQFKPGLSGGWQMLPTTFVEPARDSRHRTQSVQPAIASIGSPSLKTNRKTGSQVTIAGRCHAQLKTLTECLLENRNRSQKGNTASALR